MNHLPEPRTFILGFRTVESTGLTLSVKFSHLYYFSESLNHTCCTSKLFCVFLSAPREKSIKTIQDEIRSVIRQITATVTFLPLLDTPCKWPHISVLQESYVSVSHWGKGLIFCPFLSQVPLTSLSTPTKIWRCPKSGRSLDRRSLTNLRRCVCAPSPPPSTRWTAWWRTRGRTCSPLVHPVSCILHHLLPFREKFTLPSSTSLVLHLCPIVCVLRTVSFSFWSSLFFFVKDVEAACYCPHRCKYFSSAEFWMLVPFVSFFFVLLPLKL